MDGQFQAARQALEQLNSQPLLELLHLPAHRGMGHVHFFRRGRQVEVPGRHVEGPQWADRYAFHGLANASSWDLSYDFLSQMRGSKCRF